MIEYHVPVMLNECIDALAIKPDGIYVDLTFGGGGHSKAILDKLGKEGKLFAFDRDEDAKENLIRDERLTFIQTDYRHLKRFLKLYNIKQVDGVFADLGVSSFQLNEAERGFSYRFDGPLDMRMDASSSLTAAQILNEYSQEKLTALFSAYGEIRNSRSLARAIVDLRKKDDFYEIQDFVTRVSKSIIGDRVRYLSQLFQSLRIEVNGELESIKIMLQDTVDIVREGGRLVALTYHSLEDRLIKKFMKEGVFEGEAEKDLFGNTNKPYKMVGKPLLPTKEEIEMNNRARSAKLRIALRTKSK